MPGLFVGIVYDNYDRFVETINGKDTLHDPIGILYENISNPDDSNSSMSSSDTFSHLAKKRRTFDAIIPEIQPYTKTPILKDTLLLLVSPL